MEARLTEMPDDPRVQIAPGTLETLPGMTLPGTAVQTASEGPLQRPQSAVTLRIERYLDAAGATDRAWRGRLTAAVARDLLAHGASGEPGWAEIIAAVDRNLAAAFATAGSTPPRASARGRVALFLAGHADPGSAAAEMGGDWGAPARQPQAMPAQSLTPWRPSWRSFAAWGNARLQRLQVSRAAQGLAACLTWLAVVVIP